MNASSPCAYSLSPTIGNPAVREVNADLVLPPSHERAAHERVVRRAALDMHERHRRERARIAGRDRQHLHVHELGAIGFGREPQRRIERDGPALPRRGRLTVHDREVLLRRAALVRDSLA